MTTRRLGGLDRLRGAALVLMLVHHLIDWFGDDARAAIPGWDGFALTDVAAPAFVVTLGASVPLLIESRRRRSVDGVALAALVVRRYGLLVPIGVALRAALGFDLTHIGVLETLGLCALATAVVVRATGPALRSATAVAVCVAAPWVERAAEDSDGWIASRILTGTFPFAAYLGLALLGAAVVPALQHGPQRRPAAALAAVMMAWTFVLISWGQPPDRYPGDVSFLVPGIAGTLLLYLAVTSPWLERGSVVGRATTSVIGAAGAHTFGVFISHYLVYVVLRATGVLHDLATGFAAVAAVTLTIGIVLVAPMVPQLPWSPRTGRASVRSARPESPSVAAR